MTHVFVTGAAGFVGREVTARLRQRGCRVTALARKASADSDTVAGDLLQPETYASRLKGVDALIHLAAVTGKAPPADYVRTNVEGTRVLLDAAKRAGVTRVLFVSTIAVKFPDIARYYYAQSKVAAERLVLDSGLSTTILRPTIVSGPRSPVMTRLAALAALPIVPIFGSGHTRVQPVHVADVAGVVADIVEAARFRGETLELGGADVLTMRELLGRIHRRLRGRPATFLPVPLQATVPMLGLLERVAYGLLPLTIGQLATFRFDGTAEPNDLWNARRAAFARLDEIVEAATPA